MFKSNTDNKTDPRGDLYAGAKACAKCHQNIYNSYLNTAHFLASNPANEFTVHGNFSKGFNVFQVNDSQKVVMEKTDGGLFQNYYLNGKVKDRYRFDIVFGGVKGESYLLWKEHKLFQLPLSYFTKEKRWSTSPGYGFNFLDYPDLRSIGKTCMECHASYIDNLPGVESQQLSKGEKFDKSTIVYHIDCERCHGPGERHVEFQTHNPEFKTAKFITSIQLLSRSQKMDECAVCHSGISEIKLRSTFEFVPSDTLAKFKMPALFKQIDSSQLDVHGNQVQLLESSKCFIYSEMNCATCHNVHENSRGEETLYTQKCLSCHNIQKHTYCKMVNKLSDTLLKSNCIGCHMPALPTKVISVQVSNKLPAIQFLVHTHHIAIYPGEVKKILAYIKD